MEADEEGLHLAALRLILGPRAEVSETQDAQWSRGQEARWGLTFAALAPIGGSTALAVWLTDDPAVLLAAPTATSVLADD